MWAGDAACRMLGMAVVSVGPGSATVTMTVRDDMINGWDLCHGGLIASLADSAFAFACNSHGTVTVASGFDVTFLESARLGDELVAVGRDERCAAARGVRRHGDPCLRRRRDRRVPRPQPLDRQACSRIVRTTGSRRTGVGRPFGPN